MTTSPTRLHEETPIAFDCAGERLWGIYTRPSSAAIGAAVLIPVGGPQYRAGSHRQFVLLARALARAGIASLRFDYRGMGDSEGDLRSFEHVADDLEAGLDALLRQDPAAVPFVWGLCDAAAAAMMFCTSDPRVRGLVIANPWARSAASLGAARVRHYYLSRLFEREFWAKLGRGGLDLRASLVSLRDNLRQAGRHYVRRAPQHQSFQTRMARGLAAYRGAVLLIVSGKDLTAMEFLQYAQSDPAWKGLLTGTNVTRVDIEEADHTFSRRIWRERVEEQTAEWIRRIAGAAHVPTMRTTGGAR